MSSPLPPQPSFDGPAHIPYASATRYLWGDEASGRVADWIYVSSDKVHNIIFGMPPGGSFRHSDEFPTLLGADEVYYVLSGTLVLSNPETGEVHRVLPDEGVFFRGDTWHHGYAYGDEELRVLEFFAPPPSQGTGEAYGRTQPLLADPKYGQDHFLGRWPMARPEALNAQKMRVLREADMLWRLEGPGNKVLTGILASTEHLTVGKTRLLPGQSTDVQVHGGDETLFLLEGALNLLLPEHDGQQWFELAPWDGFYVPEGTPHQYHNYSDRPVDLLFGVAPRYEPGGEG